MLSKSWFTSLSLEELHKFIKEFFEKNQVKIKSTSITRIVAKQGSQAKTRIGGGVWANPKTLPKKIFINFIEEDNNLKMEVKMEESLGLYAKTSGMTDKYRNYFKAFIRHLEKATGIKSTTETKFIIKETLNFCPDCGSRLVKDEQTFCASCGKPLKGFIQ